MAKEENKNNQNHKLRRIQKSYTKIFIWSYSRKHLIYYTKLQLDIQG